MNIRQVFILGSPRSGTSVLAWALAQHPELWTSAESDFLLHLFRDGRIRNSWEQSVERPDGGWLQKNQVDYPEFAQCMGIGVDALFRSRSKDLIWIDQTPGHTLMAPILKDMFPFARFIHIVRDGRAVISSMLSSNFENLGFSMKWTTDFDQACKTWAVFADRGHKFVKEHPDIAIEVRHEELQVDREAVMECLLEFLSLNHSDKPAEFLARKRLNSSYDLGGKTVVAADSKVTQANKIGGWRDWPSEKKKVFERIAGAVSKTLEYSLEN